MSINPDRKTLVLGIGNILLRDEGLGVRAVEYFEDLYEPPEGVECADGGTKGVNLLSLIKGFKHLIIVDAVTGGGKPGFIRKFQWKDLEKPLPSKSTAHGLGVKELLALAEFEGFGLDVTVIGIVPEDMTAGLELSESVKNSLPEAALMIKKELEAHGFKVGRRP